MIILHEVHKAVTEHRTTLTTRLDALPDYYSARSGAVEKISTKVSEETLHHKPHSCVSIHI